METATTSNPEPGLDVDALVEQEKTKLEEERERHRRRAEKFGTEYIDPGKRREFRDEARRQRLAPHRSGFATGFDLFADEEVQKRQQRAERFNMPSQGLRWEAPQLPEDEGKRRQRAERFGIDYQAPDETGLMDVDLYEERREAPTDVMRRLNAVHVYGVDLLSTGDVLKYFADYGPTYVEWLNDSSANVLFGDEATAKRAIAGLGKPLPPEELPAGADAADAANIAYLWHKGSDFLKAGSNIPLIFRMATVLDVKSADKGQSRRLWVSAGGGSGGKRGQSQGQGRKRSSHNPLGVRRGRGGVMKQRSNGKWPHDRLDDAMGMHPDNSNDGNDQTVVKGRGMRRYRSEGAGFNAPSGAPPPNGAPEVEREVVEYGDL